MVLPLFKGKTMIWKPAFWKQSISAPFRGGRVAQSVALLHVCYSLRSPGIRESVLPDFSSSPCGAPALSECSAPSGFRITAVREASPWGEPGGRRGAVSGRGPTADAGRALSQSCFQGSALFAGGPPLRCSLCLIFSTFEILSHVFSS